MRWPRSRVSPGRRPRFPAAPRAGLHKLQRRHDDDLWPGRHLRSGRAGNLQRRFRDRSGDDRGGPGSALHYLNGAGGKLGRSEGRHGAAYRRAVSRPVPQPPGRAADSHLVGRLGSQRRKQPTLSLSGNTETVIVSHYGMYGLLATASDGLGHTATMSAFVIVDQVATSIAPVPATTVVNGGSQQFSDPTLLDEFGNPMVAQPFYAWSAATFPSGAQAPTFITSGTTTTAIFHKAGSYVLKAFDTSAANLTFSTTATVNQVATSLVQVPPSTAMVNGSSQQLNNPVLLDEFGNPMAVQPACTWAATTLPSGAKAPTFSTSGTTTTVVFSRAGIYSLKASVAISGVGTLTFGVTATVNQVATSFTQAPVATVVVNGVSQQFSRSGRFGSVRQPHGDSAQLHLGGDDAAQRRPGADLQHQRHDHHGGFQPGRQLCSEGVRRRRRQSHVQHHGNRKPNVFRHHRISVVDQRPDGRHAAIHGSRVGPVPQRHGNAARFRLVGQRGHDHDGGTLHRPRRVGHRHGFRRERRAQRQRQPDRRRLQLAGAHGPDAGEPRSEFRRRRLDQPAGHDPDPPQRRRQRRASVRSIWPICGPSSAPTPRS